MIPELDLLARLRDAHPPPAPGWWPLAPGWWLALALVVALAALAIRYGPPWWRRLRMRRRLLAALEAIARRHRAGAPVEATATDISALLRRAALARFPDRGVAGLHGGAWVAFLDTRGGESDAVPGPFTPLQEALTVAPYGAPGATLDAAALLQAARSWLRAVA